MATIPTRPEVFYPESDGKPMAETPRHREVMTDLIEVIGDRFVDDPLAYVSGNMFLYFVEGEPRRNVSPDVMVVLGVDKLRERNTYKTWEEGGKAPDLVIEVTSRSTRREDIKEKFALYRDELKVREYFLFDPLGDYLRPPLQGYRLIEGEYLPIEPEAGRLPSRVLNLHLEAVGRELRLCDPESGRRLPTRPERIEAEAEARRKANSKLRRTTEELRQKDATIQEKDVALRQAGEEIARLRREVEALQAGKKPKPKKRK